MEERSAIRFLLGQESAAQFLVDAYGNENVGLTYLFMGLKGIDRASVFAPLGLKSDSQKIWALGMAAKLEGTPEKERAKVLKLLDRWPDPSQKAQVIDKVLVWWEPKEFTGASLQLLNQGIELAYQLAEGENPELGAKLRDKFQGAFRRKPSPSSRLSDIAGQSQPGDRIFLLTSLVSDYPDYRPRDAKELQWLEMIRGR